MLGHAPGKLKALGGAIAATALCAAIWLAHEPAEARVSDIPEPVNRINVSACTFANVTISSGGGAITDPSTGANRGFTVVGQPAIGRMTGEGYTLDAGVVPVLFRYASADLNMDGAVNSSDFNLFLGCATGPDVAYIDALPTGCVLYPGPAGQIAADIDGDGDVDSADFAIIQRCYSGILPGSPLCR